MLSDIIVLYARVCVQVLLDRSGSGLVTPHDLLAAAHTAVTLGVGIIPKARVDISDVLLQLVVMLMQQQQQAGQSIAAQVCRPVYIGPSALKPA